MNGSGETQPKVGVASTRKDFKHEISAVTMS